MIKSNFKFNDDDKEIQNDQESMKIFGEEFKNGVLRLINQESEQKKINLNEYEEILLHAKHCINLTNGILQNDDLCSRVEKYILDVANTTPFIVTGKFNLI